MKAQNKYRKIQLQIKNIQELEKENSRFKRIYSEYEDMSHQLLNLEDPATDPVPDDFMDAIYIQTSYLEDEIEDWLKKYQRETKKNTKS